ncbi:MAG: hypothetical protein R3E97_12195 [Candidatus Eisenbacteria bacterium]
MTGYRSPATSFVAVVACISAAAMLLGARVSSAAERFGGALCLYDLTGGVSEPVPSMAHCTCTEEQQGVHNSDGAYDKALMWRGAGLGEGSGMVAEYYETRNGEPGAVCLLYLHITSLDSSIRTSIDLYVWDDADGEPGQVLGILPDLPLFSVAPYPAVGTRDWDIFERMPIGVQGGFWLGIRGNWDTEECSVLVPLDTFDDDPKEPAVRRSAVTYVGPGVDELSEGWHSIEEIVGVPAATGINGVIGYCPVPVLETSWGKVKQLYLDGK